MARPSSSKTSPIRKSTSATGPSCWPNCSNATKATRSPRSRPTTPAPANVDEWGGAAPLSRATSRSRKRAPTSKCVLERQKGDIREQATRSELGYRVRLGRPNPAAWRALALAVGLVLADSSVVVLALPEIYRDLDTERRRRHLGPRLVQPRDGARRGAGGPRRASGRAGTGGRGRARDLRRGRPRLRALRPSLEHPDRRPLRSRRWAGRSRSRRCSSCCPRRSARSAARPRSGRPPGRPARRSARRSAASSPSSSPGSRSSCSRCRSRSLAAVPILAVARHEAATGSSHSELRQTGRPHILANVALAMVSAAIAAALFLLVLLLIEGWRLTPDRRRDRRRR